MTTAADNLVGEAVQPGRPAEPPRLTLQFKARDPQLTPGHVLEVRVPGAPPIFFTRDESRELVRRVNAFLQGTR